MNYRFFTDESGTHSLNAPIFSIGGFVLEEEQVESIEEALDSICRSYLVESELKWTAMGRHRSIQTQELAEDAARALFAAGARFHAIVVNKRTFRLWQGDREEAFWRAYGLLTQNVTERLQTAVRMSVDDRSDRYPRRHEVLQIVSNHSLRKNSRPGSVASVDRIDSRSSRIVQMADILVGAITADTTEYIDPHLVVAPRKREVSGMLASILGWDRLWYDTMPNEHVNVWHFPPDGFRGLPETSEVSLQL